MLAGHLPTFPSPSLRFLLFHLLGQALRGSLNHGFDVSLSRTSGILRALGGQQRRACGLFLAECHLAKEIHAEGTTRAPGAFLPATGKECQVLGPWQEGLFKDITCPVFALLAFSPSALLSTKILHHAALGL